MGHLPGTIVDGRYTISRVIGEGGHGIVYEAKDQVLGSRVAIKCLHANVASEPGFKTRMMREARAMGALSGTSAVQVLGVGRDGEVGMYIAMELVDGRDLDRYLRELEAEGTRIDVSKLVAIMSPIVETLAVAHDAGIIHRDLKPGNIMVLDSTARGSVRLLDFGLAKDMSAETLTLEGTIAGSPSYIAPEGWRGKSDQIDHRLDVYALGAVIFRALAGAPPFDARVMPLDQFLVAVLRGPRPSLHALRPDLPPAVDGWAQRALALARDDRFASVRELWSAFRTIVG